MFYISNIHAHIRDYRGADPYKSKGVKCAGEFIFRAKLKDEEEVRKFIGG
ncbi:MAG: hypothetical protein ACRCWO_11920 [Bosea sp. (in: a-proteobacteria)]